MLAVPFSIFELSAQFIGAVALVTIAAAVTGYVIMKIWPKSLNPPPFAVLVPLFGMALAAYWGSSAAAAAIVMFLILAVFGALSGLA